MKVFRIVSTLLLVFAFSSIMYTFAHRPEAEIERYDFQRPLVLMPKIPAGHNPGPPVPDLPPGVDVKVPKSNDSEFNGLGLDTKQSQLSTSFSNYGGASLPMLNTSAAPSQVERLKEKIERVIKKLNL